MRPAEGLAPEEATASTGTVVAEEAAAEASPGTTGRPPKPRHRWRTLAWWGVTAVVVASFWHANLDLDALLHFPQNAVHYARLMFGPPDLGTLGKALAATLLSVQMAWFGTMLGVAVSLPLSFLATRGLTPRPVLLVVRLVFALLRAVPEVVIAILILSVTGLTPFTGALAIGFGSMGTLGKWSYEAMEGVDRGPVEAVRAAGGSRSQVIRWGIWTSAQPEVLAFWLYRFEISVRASAILGLIGAGGIGKVLIDNVHFRIWDAVGMLLIVVVSVTVVLDLISGVLRRRIITGRWSAPRLRKTVPGSAGAA